MASSSFLAKEEADVESKTTMPNWIELPNDITANILKRLPTVEIVTSVCLVCPLWWNICKDPLIWRSINYKYSYYINMYYNSIQLNKIWRYAIKRSCGHLEEIDIDSFGSDDLLQFIADNGSNLRCIRIVGCYEISDKGFSEAVMKFPHLEEVEISLSNLTKDSLEALGNSCPFLKKLKFMSTWVEYCGEDDEALIISKTMPKLCNLDIQENCLTNVGLLAILDGCPLLESLDIQECDNVILTNSLVKRCVEQIKYLHLPEQYSSDDGEYDWYKDYDYDSEYDLYL